MHGCVHTKMCIWTCRFTVMYWLLAYICHCFFLTWSDMLTRLSGTPWLHGSSPTSGCCTLSLQGFYLCGLLTDVCWDCEMLAEWLPLTPLPCPLQRCRVIWTPVIYQCALWILSSNVESVGQSLTNYIALLWNHGLELPSSHTLPSSCTVWLELLKRLCLPHHFS